MKKFLMMAFAGLMMCSCSSIYHTSATADVNTSVYSIAVADINVNSSKVQKTYNWNYNPFKKVSIETIKSNVTAELLQQSDADVLVEPEYIIERRGFLRGGSVTAIGFPAKYTNFHKANSEEVQIIKEVMKSAENNKTPRKRFFFF